jgi:hypothetical protein
MKELIAKRLAEVQELAKQHEVALFQLSGAIQELNYLLANMKEDHATDKITDQESLREKHQS